MAGRAVSHPGLCWYSERDAAWFSDDALTYPVRADWMVLRSCLPRRRVCAVIAASAFSCCGMREYFSTECAQGSCRCGIFRSARDCTQIAFGQTGLNGGKISKEDVGTRRKDGKLKERVLCSVHSAAEVAAGFGT